MNRSAGISVITSPRMRATGIAMSSEGWALLSTISSTLMLASSCWPVSSVIESSSVVEAHGIAHIAHRFLRRIARFLAAVGDDVLHQGRVLLERRRALAHRLQFLDDGVDHRLLAFQATDAGALAALHHPVMRGAVRIHLMQRPYRALFRVARVRATDTRRVGRHGADLFGHTLFRLAQIDGVAVTLRHL